MTLTFTLTCRIRYSDSTSLSTSMSTSTAISDLRLMKSVVRVKFYRNLPRRWTLLATSKSDMGSLIEYLI